jgi:hypothetical protein
LWHTDVEVSVTGGKPLTVFRLEVDPAIASTLVLGEEDTATWFERLRLDGTPREPDWRPPRVRREIRHRQVPDVWYLVGCESGFAYAENACAVVKPYSASAEFLPLTVLEDNGTHLDESSAVMWLQNVIEVADCLDRQSAMVSPSGLVTKYEFHVDKLPRTGFFKVPESADSDILYLENWDDARPPLGSVTARGLRGLQLQQAWSVVDGGIDLSMPFVRR